MSEHANCAPLHWSPQSIARFWNFEASREDAHTNYFSYQYGRALARFAGRVDGLRDKRVLDFGSGPGFLSSELLACGARVAATDPSVASVDAVSRSLDGQPGWLGAHVLQEGRCSLPDASFDIVFCVETIEHVLPEELTILLSEIRRLLRDGGLAVLTTPHAENLARQHVLCANCGAVFHRWQHLRSWTPALLRRELESRAFTVEFCDGMNLGCFAGRAPRGLLDLSLRSVAHGCVSVVDRMVDHTLRTPFPRSREFCRLVRSHATPHLVALARTTS